MSEKNICQNPKCCDNNTNDRWNKKLNAFQSRKAYYKLDHERQHGWGNRILEYFCTTRCANTWLEDNLENVIERKDCPNKILEKKIRA